MAEASSAPVKTFTVGFEGAGAYDERPAAREVAERFGCEHREAVLAPQDALELLPACVGQLDEPHGDATALASYALARVAARQLPVVLTGVGGDELFAGYRRYQAGRLAPAARLASAPLVGGLARALAERLPASGRSRAEDAVRLARKFLASAGDPLERRYLSWNAAFTATEKNALLAGGDETDSLAWAESFFHDLPAGPFVTRAQLVDLQTYLPHDPLALTDATTMAWGLEARVPLCDHVLADWALGLPADLHVRGLRGKALLRRAVAPLLPDEILRRGKRGFSLPTDVWLRGALAEDATRLLDPRHLQPAGLFDPAAVARLLGEHASGRRDRSQHLWALLVFQVWYRLLLERSQPDRLAEVA